MQTFREAAQTSVFDSFDMVVWNPQKVNKFFSSTCMHVLYLDSSIYFDLNAE